MAVQPLNPSPGAKEEWWRRVLWMATKLRESFALAPGIRMEQTPENLKAFQERFALLYRHLNLNLAEAERERLTRDVLNEVAGFGPIEELITDESVTEIMVNGPALVYVERRGRIELTPIKFLDNDHVLQTIEKIIKPLGRRVDRAWPLVDARLPDGSRVNAIIPPCALDGPTITIRKFSKKKLTVDDLIKFGSLTEQMAQFLKACVVSRLNIVVSGGTGSGKTTLLNVLSGYIPEDERIITVEDAAELQLAQTHVVRLETKPVEANEPTGRPVTIRDLVINTLRMRPERIIVGECRGGEALDMLQAMNTGHDGSLTTVHANSPRDAMSRLETLVLMAGMDLPLSVVRRQIASAINLIVQQARLRDGSRKVTNITEIQGLEGETPILQDIFVFEELGEENGKVVGRVKPTGIRPSFMPRLINHGFNLPASVFMDREAMAAGGRPTRR